jgi:hypothetical protein
MPNLPTADWEKLLQLGVFLEGAVSKPIAAAGGVGKLSAYW